VVERVEAMAVERAKRMARGNELEEVEVGAVISAGLDRRDERVGRAKWWGRNGVSTSTTC